MGALVGREEGFEVFCFGFGLGPEVGLEVDTCCECGVGRFEVCVESSAAIGLSVVQVLVLVLVIG